MSVMTMSTMTKKLKSKSGISLAIALVFFLLCAMVGTVVLSAASVSAGKTAREREAYRQTLAMTSAANLLKEDLQTMTFTGTYAKTETVTTTVTPGNPPDVLPSTEVTTATAYEKGTGALTDSRIFVMSGHQKLDLGDLFFYNQEELKTDLVVTLDPVVKNLVFGEIVDQNIPAVNATLTVGLDYTITVVLSCGENQMILTFAPQVSEQVTVAEPTVTNSDDETQSTKTTVTTYTTTIRWEAPVIQEGGASG